MTIFAIYRYFCGCFIFAAELLFLWYVIQWNIVNKTKNSRSVCITSECDTIKIFRYVMDRHVHREKYRYSWKVCRTEGGAYILYKYSTRVFNKQKKYRRIQSVSFALAQSPKFRYKRSWPRYLSVVVYTMIHLSSTYRYTCIRQIYTPQNKFCTTYTIFFVFTVVGCTDSYFVQIIWCSCWFCNPRPPPPPRFLLRYVLLYLWSPKGGCCSISDDLFLKLWESVILPSVKKNVWNNAKIMYEYVETNTQFFF